VIKSRIGWAGYVVCMGRGEALGRPRCRWEDNIKMDLQGMGCGGTDWVKLLQEGRTAGTCECGNEPSGSIKCGEFLD
jgi:hypothetical protein